MAKVSSGRVSHSSNIPVINLILIDNIGSCRITSITSPLHFFYSIQKKNNYEQIYNNVVRNNRDKRFYLVQIINHYRAYNTSNCETNMNRVISPSSNVNLKIISHLVYLNELTHLLSYTPQLSHLYCSNIIQSEELMKLNNLVHLSITRHNLIFDKFEEFFLKLFSQLRVLTVTINCSDNNYLNGFRWEQLINHHMPVKKISSNT
ncbi:unnamed protein product [Rotaria sordida]|uniref:Uncharacterized protein n=1 Tax=Rotaria sordida TaxID=392033 RepID=A0A818X0G2_9BILA|nr:unnamed protein product [Rotaria sordida]